MSANTFLDKVKAGHPIHTRDGKPVKFIAHVPEASEHSRLLVLVGGSVVALSENGAFSKDLEMSFDVFLAPNPKVKREGWVAVAPYHGSRGIRDTSSCYRTKEEAAGIMDNQWPVARIEWEE